MIRSLPAAFSHGSIGTGLQHSVNGPGTYSLSKMPPHTLFMKPSLHHFIDQRRQSALQAVGAIPDHNLMYGDLNEIARALAKAIAWKPQGLVSPRLRGRSPLPSLHKMCGGSMDSSPAVCLPRGGTRGNACVSSCPLWAPLNCLSISQAPSTPTHRSLKSTASSVRSFFPRLFGWGVQPGPVHAHCLWTNPALPVVAGASGG